MSETGEFSVVNPWNIISASDNKIFNNGRQKNYFVKFSIIFHNSRLAVVLARWFPIASNCIHLFALFLLLNTFPPLFCRPFLIPHASFYWNDLKAHLKAFLTPHLHNKHDVVNDDGEVLSNR